MMAWFTAALARTRFGCIKTAKEERGDTNFISILIILGIVILLAGLFIAFKDQIVGMVEGIVNDFTIH